MYIYETYLHLREPSPYLSYKQHNVPRNYFFKNGKNPLSVDWFKLYWVIKEFKLMFKFKYSLRTHLLTASFVPYKKRWANQMGFLKFYLRILKFYKWHQFDPRNLTSFLKKAKRICYSNLVESAL